MTAGRCVFFDADPVYRERFLAYVRRREPERFALTAAENAADCLRRAAEWADALLVGQSTWDGWEASAREALLSRGIPCLLLTESEQEAEESGVRPVCRYQPAARILELLWESLTDGEHAGSESALCIGFWAPTAAGGQTARALALAHRLAEERSVLFVSLSAVPSFELPEDEARAGSISDLLYRIRTEGRLRWQAELVCHAGRLALLPPAANPEDIWEASAEELAALLREILRLCGAETVVCELPGGVCPLPLFAVCDEIRLLYEDTVDGRHGLGQFRNYLHRAAGGELLARCREEAVRPVPALAEFSACDPQLRYSCREPETGAFPGI